MAGFFYVWKKWRATPKGIEITLRIVLHRLFSVSICSADELKIA
jgi:hypothetical protein